MSNLDGRAARRVVLQSSFAQHFPMESPVLTSTNHPSTTISTNTKTSTTSTSAPSSSTTTSTSATCRNLLYMSVCMRKIRKFIVTYCKAKKKLARRFLYPHVFEMRTAVRYSTQTNMHTQANCENANTRALEVEKEQRLHTTLI